MTINTIPILKKKMTITSRWPSFALIPIGIVSIYVLFLALILHPNFQAQNVFLHGFNYPFHFDLKDVDKVKGIAKGKIRNFTLFLPKDQINIQGYHIVPQTIDTPKTQNDFDQSLCDFPVVLYFHGNAMNRASPIRIRAYQHFTKLGMNVVAIDYRGFGDSQGHPTEQGLLRDARATYKWVLERQKECGAKNSTKKSNLAGQILISGQSLGTGVASRLTFDLVEAGHPPPATFLLAPYISIRKVLESYRIGGFVPLFWPIRISKALSGIADKYLYTKFESDKALYVATRGGMKNLNKEEKEEFGNLDHQLTKQELLEELGIEELDQSNRQDPPPPPHIVISHADDDQIIPHTHGKGLFDKVHDALTFDSNDQIDIQQTETDFIPQQIHIEERDWGTLLTFSPNPGQPNRLSLIKSKKGGHNGVPVHALEYFINVATDNQPARAADTSEVEIE
jgi:abhydrolase domain-containing protein 12